MSDDEDLLLTKKLESLESTINIASANEGTREEQERARLVALASALMRETGDGTSNKELGQIHISNGNIPIVSFRVSSIITGFQY